MGISTLAELKRKIATLETLARDIQRARSLLQCVRDDSPHRLFTIATYSGGHPIHLPYESVEPILTNHLNALLAQEREVSQSLNLDPPGSQRDLFHE